MRTFITLLAAMTLAVSCTDSNESNYSLSEEANKNTGKPIMLDKDNVVDLTNMNSLGIGDVESQMALAVTLDPSSYSDTVEHSETKNERKRMALASATISAPYPEVLNMNVFNGNAENFPGHAYRGTVKLYVEDKEVESFAYITGKNAKDDLQMKVYDIMSHLEAAPGNSYLVTAKCTIEFYHGVDDKTLTLDSPGPTYSAPTVRMSNPMRVTFN
jgi:hypothetical protein